MGLLLNLSHLLLSNDDVLLAVGGVSGCEDKLETLLQVSLNYDGLLGSGARIVKDLQTGVFTKQLWWFFYWTTINRLWPCFVGSSAC